MALKDNIFINEVAYDWGSIELLLQGIPVVGISEVSFNENFNTKNYGGTGVYPVHTGFGKNNCSASIVLNADDIFTLQNFAINGIIQNLPMFDIIVTFRAIDYFNDLTSNLPRVVIIKNCRFTNSGIEVSQNDMDIKYKFNLSATHIVYKQQIKEFDTGIEAVNTIKGTIIDTTAKAFKIKINN